MSPVTLPLAVFLGTFLQTLSVGVFIPLFIVASYAQWKKVSRGQKVNVVMALATVFFGLSVPTHWILGLRRAIVAILYRPPGVTVEQYLQPPYSTDEIARWAIFQLSLVVGDLVMIYRMFHIYDRSLLACAIPSITTSGLIVIACGLTNQLRHLKTQSDLKTYSGWSTSCFCVTLFNCAFMSGAICHRLWKMHRETIVSGVNLKSESITLRAMRGLVESAALWTFFVSMNFFAFLANSSLSYTFLDMTSPVVGISFCLIIVRLSTVTPTIREDTWESSERTRASRHTANSRLSGLPVLLDRVKVERDVFVSESESGIDFHMTSSVSSPFERTSPVH